jgi:hypothetical protein
VRPLVLLSLSGLVLLGCPGSLEDPGRFTITQASADPSCDAPALLQAKCATCHGRASPMGDLALDTPAALGALHGKAAKGGAGTLIDLGTPASSVLYTKLSSPAPFGGVMPPSRPLDDKDKECVRSWLEGLGDGT